MERADEVKVLSIVLLILLEAGKQDRDGDATVSWRTIDALADIFRGAGVDVPANLGTVTS